MKKSNLFLVVLFAIIVLLGILFPCCSTVSLSDKAAFTQCSENEGDLGCDSCYFRIYGKLINPFTGESVKVNNPEWIQAHQDYLNSR